MFPLRYTNVIPFVPVSITYAGKNIKITDNVTSRLVKSVSTSHGVCHRLQPCYCVYEVVIYVSFYTADYNPRTIPKLDVQWMLFPANSCTRDTAFATVMKSV